MKTKGKSVLVSKGMTKGNHKKGFTLEKEINKGSVLEDPIAGNLEEKYDDSVQKLIDIGKEIDSYNGIDCGIFRLNKDFFEAARSAAAIGLDSISAAVKILIKNRQIEAVFMEPEDDWIDIDTPEAYQFCLKKITEQLKKAFG